MSAPFILRAVSVCGTYKETMKCLTLAEAEGYKVALEAEGWKVQIIDKTGAA